MALDLQDGSALQLQDGGTLDLQAASDPLFSDVVSLLNGGEPNGSTTIVDSATSPVTKAMTGTLSYTDSWTDGAGTSITGWGRLDYNNAQFDLNQDWTQELVCYDSNPGGYLWSNRGGDAGLEYVIITGNYITLWVGGVNRVNVPMGDGITYHVAVTYEASTGTFRIFVDGVYQGQYVNAAALENNFYLGGYSAGGGEWTGEIESFRWTNAIRYPGTDNFVRPTSPLPTGAPPTSQPTIDTQPQSITRSSNTAASFTVAATTSGGILTYQWYEITAGLLGGETTDTLSFTCTDTDNGNQYYCAVSDDNGTVNSSNATLTVIAELLITMDPAPIDVLEYRPSSFSVMATGGLTPLTYDWYGTSAGLLAADAGNTYSIASTPLSLNGDTVYCRVTENGTGTKDSTAALATVSGASHPDPGGNPLLDGDITGPANVTILIGSSGTLSVTLTEITGVAPYTVDWYNDAVGLYAADAGTSLEYTPAALAESGMLWWVVIQDSQGYYGQSGQATMAVVGAQLEVSWTVEDATSDKTVVINHSIAWSLADGRTQADYDNFKCPVRTHRAISTEDGHTYWIPFYDKSAKCHRGPLVNDKYNRYYWTQDGQGLRYDTFQNLEYNSFTDGYDAGVPAPEKVPAVAAAQPVNESGIFVTRAYVYTYVTVYGEEGPPSPPTTADGIDGGLWQLSNMLGIPDDGKRRLLASKNIYRTVPAETGVAEYHYVGSVGINTPIFFDDIPDEEVSRNRIMESNFWYPPPEDLSGLTAHPNGFFVGYSGRDIYFSEPYRPHAWNPNYTVSTLGEIVGFGIFGTTVVVCTNSFPYTATGIHPQAMVLTQHDTAEPCLSRYGIVSMPFGVYYPGPNGLILAGSQGFRNATKDLMTKEEWQNRYQVKTFDGARYQSQYVALYNTTKGIMFAPDEPMAALVDIDLASGQVEPDQADSIFTDEYSGKTYLLSSCDMYEWNPVSGAALEFDWTSMEFDASDPVNFGAGRIIWYSDWTPPTEEETWAWRIYNTSRIAAAPLMPMNFNVTNGVNVIPGLVYDLTVLDSYPDIDQTKVQTYLDNFEQIKQAFHWGPLVWVPAIGAQWPNTPYVVMELIANNQVVYEREISHTRMFRLPAGFKATRFKIRLRSNINIQSVKVAETGKELAGF